MKNNTQKEKIGVNYLKELCLESRYLEPNISENDKTPSFDGYILLYKKEMPKDSKGYLKEFFEKAIPIQVKTTEKEGKFHDKIEYKITVTDLRNFFKEDGVLFFVVVINKEDNKQKCLYYNNLTKVKIQSILDENERGTKKKKIKIDCYKLNKSLESVVRKFYMSFNKQRLIDVDGRCVTLDSYIDSSEDVNNIDLSEDVNNIEIYYMKRRDVVEDAEIYVEKKYFNGSNIYVPLDYEASKQIIEHLVCISNVKVKINENRVYNAQCIRRLIDLDKKSSVLLKLSENLSIDFLGVVEGRGVQFKFVVKSNMFSILNDLKFLYEISQFGYVYIDERKLKIKKDINEKDINRIADMFLYYLVLSLMLVNKDINSCNLDFCDIDYEIKKRAEDFCLQEGCNIVKRETIDRFKYIDEKVKLE